MAGAFDEKASRARYGRPLACDFETALAIAISYSNAASVLAALYEIDARSDYEHHSSIEPTLRRLEREVELGVAA